MFFYFIFIFALYCCSFCLFCLSLLFLSLITGFVFSFHSLTLSCSFSLYFVIFHTFLFLHFHLFSFFIDFFSLGLDSVSSLVLSALCCCPILSYTPAEFICLFPLCCLFFCFLPFLVSYPLALFLFFFHFFFFCVTFFPLLLHMFHICISATASLAAERLLFFFYPSSINTEMKIKCRPIISCCQSFISSLFSSYISNYAWVVLRITHRAESWRLRRRKKIWSYP